MEKIILILLIVLGVILTFKLFSLKIRLIFRLFLSVAAGFVFLIIINYIGSFIGISLGINIVNALIIGILGIPGILLLLIITML